MHPHVHRSASCWRCATRCLSWRGFPRSCEPAAPVSPPSSPAPLPTPPLPSSTLATLGNWTPLGSAPWVGVWAVAAWGAAPRVEQASAVGARVQWALPLLATPRRTLAAAAAAAELVCPPPAPVSVVALAVAALAVVVMVAGALYLRLLLLLLMAVVVTVVPAAASALPTTPNLAPAGSPSGPWGGRGTRPPCSPS